MTRTKANGPEYSEAGLALLRGAYDMHQHVSPDLWERKLDAYDYADRASRLGMGGIVYKHHATETGSWASILSRSFPDVRLYGSFVINHASSGGWNASVVESALLLGARIVYMPTVSAEHMINKIGMVHTGPGERPSGASSSVYPMSKDTPNGYPFGMSIFAPDGSIRPEVIEILDLIRAYDVVLGTGHLSAKEIMALVPVAQEMGVKRILATHVMFPFIGDLSREQKLHLANTGVYLEHCVQVTRDLPIFRKKFTTVEAMVAEIRDVSASQCVYSTNLGQADLASPEVGLIEGIEELLGAGMTSEEVRLMVTVNPEALLAS